MEKLKAAIRSTQIPRFQSLINGCLERQFGDIPYDGYYYGVAFGIISTLADAGIISVEEYRKFKMELIDACGRNHPNV